MPYYGFGFQVRVVNSVEVVPSSLGIPALTGVASQERVRTRERGGGGRERAREKRE
jgi:hypothetical protein